MTYNPLSWSWLADDGRVYLSARQAIVDSTDADFLSLKAAAAVTRWPIDEAGTQTLAALQDVLTPYGLFTSPAAALMAYANLKQWALATGGYTLTLSGRALAFSTDTASQALITGKYIRLTQPNPPATISWQFPSGFVSISQADFVKTASAIADFIQATFDTLEAVFAGIAAGTITTSAEVDAAAWPPNAVAP